MFGGLEWGDMNNYLQFLQPNRGQRSNSGSSSSGTSPSNGGSKNRNNPFSSFMRPYMNNPYGMNAQKCMDNDMCTQFITTQMYGGASRAFGGMGGYGGGQGGYGGGYNSNPSNSNPSNSNPSFGPSSSDSGITSTGGEVDSTATSTISDSGSADSGVVSGSPSTDSGISSSGNSGSSNSGGNNNRGRGFNFSPAMFGFPQGFNPMSYGLDWDSLPADCMDDSKCARGMMMYPRGGRGSSGGRSGFSVDPRVVNFASNLFGFPTLQKPRFANYYGAHEAYHY